MKITCDMNQATKIIKKGNDYVITYNQDGQSLTSTISSDFTFNVKTGFKKELLSIGQLVEKYENTKNELDDLVNNKANAIDHETPEIQNRLENIVSTGFGLIAVSLGALAVYSVWSNAGQISYLNAPSILKTIVYGSSLVLGGAFGALVKFVSKNELRMNDLADILAGKKVDKQINKLTNERYSINQMLYQVVQRYSN